ncbi:hypothetical protein IJ531_05835, partial [bacterium]|nr:hypothetical protein [bacterium]
MTQSKAQLFNITLNILGVSTPLENANSNDNRAILLNNYYDLARDYVLKDYDWNFASLYRKLTLCDKKTENYKFSYCYDYPNDCICARDIYDKNYNKTHKFMVSALDNNQKVILCDIQDAILRYTKRIEKEVFYPCEFSMALSYYLASLTSSVLTGSIQKGELAYEKYRSLIKRAKVLNAQEG